MKDFIEQNKWIVGVFAVMLAIGAGWLEWRVDAIVSAKIKGNSTVVAAGQITPDRISALEASLVEARARHESDAARMDGKIERIVDILLEE